MGGIKHLQPLSCKKLQHLHFSNVLPYLDMIFLSRELCLGSTGGGGESGSSVEISVWPAIFFGIKHLLSVSTFKGVATIRCVSSVCLRDLSFACAAGTPTRQHVQKEIRSWWFLCFFALTLRDTRGASADQIRVVFAMCSNKKLASSNILANNGGQHEGGSWFKIFITFCGPFWTLAGSS